MKMMRLLLTTLLLLFILFSIPGAVLAGEGGSSAWIPGFRDLLGGYLPPPGTYLNNLVIIANLKDDSNVAGGKPRVTANADLLTITHVTKAKVFGGDYAISVRFPYMFNLDVQASPARLTGPGGRHQSSSGFGDIVLSPMVLGWHKGKAHYMTASNVYFPTAPYDSTSIANVSRKRWVVEQDFGITYFADKHWELSGFLGYTVPFENQVTKYWSGNELHLDYAIGYHFDKNATLGLAGYYFTQTTPDSGRSAIFGSYEGQVTGLGPVFSYKAQDVTLKLKYTRDLDSRNRLNGDWYWFNAVFKL